MVPWQFASGIAYHILRSRMTWTAWRWELQQRLEATLGGERSSLLGQEIDGYLRDEWNDLGEGERTIGFVWHPEANGSQSIWYAIKDQRHGAGTFRRYLPGFRHQTRPSRTYAELSRGNCQSHNFESRPNFDVPIDEGTTFAFHSIIVCV
jgi:hypothetical protein